MRFPFTKHSNFPYYYIGSSTQGTAPISIPNSMNSLRFDWMQSKIQEKKIKSSNFTSRAQEYRRKSLYLKLMWFSVLVDFFNFFYVIFLLSFFTFDSKKSERLHWNQCSLDFFLFSQFNHVHARPHNTKQMLVQVRNS